MNFSITRKMQYEYTTYVANCHTSLQYYTTNINNTSQSREKYTYHITPDYKKHNIYGPATTKRYPNDVLSYIRYYINGKLHNEHKPAITQYHSNGIISSTTYYINDHLHNEHGPAFAHYHLDGTITCARYWKDGIAVRHIATMDQLTNRPISPSNRPVSKAH